MNATESASCPLCEAPMRVKYQLPHIWHLPGGTKPYQVAWCDRCDHGMLAPPPTFEELRAFYDESYFTRYAGETAEQFQGQGGRRVEPPSLLDKVRLHLSWRMDRGQPVDAEMVHRTLGEKPARVCDIGCGNGALLAELRDRGHDVVGVEIDPRAVERVRSLDLVAYPGTAEDLPAEVEPGGFDAVVMTHVLEHCPDPIRALGNAASLLRPGGLLIVEVPNNESISAARSGPCWFYADAGRHLNFFTPASLTAMYRRVGLEVGSLVFSGYCAAFTNDRVVAEGAVYDLLYDSPAAARANQDQPNSRSRQWGTLASSMLAPPRRKYEVFGLVGRRPGGPSASRNGGPPG